MKSRLSKTIIAIILAMNIMCIPVMANSRVAEISVEPRLNNISTASLGLSFDTNDMVYCSFTILPYSHCTGYEGIMRLYDSNGTRLKSWALTDYVSPYETEQTYQGTYGETYTLTFQGYAYGTNTMFDEINLEVTSTNRD